MTQEVSMAAAPSWLGRFATVWSARTTQAQNSGGDEAEADECSDALARLCAPTRSSLPRFDDTVAAPIDAPERLGEIIRTAADALTRLPPAHQLSHRTVCARATLQRVVHDAIEARARLAAGSYGICTSCSGPISLSSLSEKPWTPWCIYCALSI